MRATLIIAAHQIRRVVRNPGLILLLLAIPLTLALMEYAAFGRTAAAGKLPPTKVLFLDEDDTLASGFLPQVFSGGPAKDFFELAQVPSRDEAARMFKRGQASALIVVPKGFQDALLAGTRCELVFYPNPIQSIGPEISRSMLEMTTLIGNGLYAQALEPIGRIKALFDANREPTLGRSGRDLPGLLRGRAPPWRPRGAQPTSRWACSGRGRPRRERGSATIRTRSSRTCFPGWSSSG